MISRPRPAKTARPGVFVTNFVDLIAEFLSSFIEIVIYLHASFQNGVKLTALVVLCLLPLGNPVSEHNFTTF